MTRERDYFGPSVNRCARLMAVAHGGQVVLSSATAALVRGRDDLLDLGEHRLRDLAEAERVSQVGPETFPPLRSLGRVPGNLQPQLTSFVGRDREVAELVAELGRRRIVTLTGAGGVGKTRLATQVGAEVSADYQHGVWMVELAPVSDPDAVPDALASTLGLQPRPMMTILEGIQQHLAERRVLLVLDNCEHLLDAAGHVVETLIRACPGVSVLATSREALAIDGEQAWPLRSLAADTDAVQLFADRARAVRPSFALLGDDVAAVEEICRRLDGIPLAIELAAARTVSLSPREIAGRLDERFRLLTGGRRTAVGRHQTLRATVDWSYDLLDAATRRVFDRLAVFAGGFTLESAEAVVPDDEVVVDDVLDAISDLVGKSMVLADVQPDGTHRYGLLETMRQYGQERLEVAGIAEVVAERHARAMADFSRQAAHGWRTRDEQRWRRRVGAEIDNLRAAVGWALAHGDVDVAVRLVALPEQALFQPSWGIAALVDRTLALPDVDRHPAVIRVLAAVAADRLLRGDLDGVYEVVERAAAIADEPGREPAAWIFAAGAAAATVLGDYARVKRYLALAVPRAEATGDPYEIAFVLAYAAGAVPDDETAGHRYAERAMAVVSEVGPEIRSNITGLCAMPYFESDPDIAIARFEEALAFGVESGLPHVNAWAAAYVAPLYADRGDARAAFETTRDGMRHSHDDGDLGILVSTVEFTGVALAILGRHELAAVLFAAVDAGTVSYYPIPPPGWQARVRTRGRCPGPRRPRRRCHRPPPRSGRGHDDRRARRLRDHRARPTARSTRNVGRRLRPSEVEAVEPGHVAAQDQRASSSGTSRSRSDMIAMDRGNVDSECG